MTVREAARNVLPVLQPDQVEVEAAGIASEVGGLVEREIVGGVLSHAYRPRGSSASRKPSPSRLNASTSMKIASPGQIAIQGAWSM